LTEKQMLNWTRMNILLAITIILSGCVGGCKSKNLKYDQICQETDASSESRTDAYQSYDDALRTYVDSSGYVDYSNLRQNPLKLNTFIDFLAKVSPENYPELFPTQNDKKAYWINAYNALMMKSVIDNPGITSVNQISWGKGIFWRIKFIVGGKECTLHRIENSILRKKYKDPRIHFAINCASSSCSPLSNRILSGDSLDEQLDYKLRQFIQNSSNVYLNHDKKEIKLSRIFKWYKNDFTANGMSLKEYVLQFLLDIPDWKRKTVLQDYKLGYFEYDWNLNEKMPGKP